MIKEENGSDWGEALKELREIFVYRLWVMALVSVAVVGGMLLVSRMTFVPVYSSTATLYILLQDTDNDTGKSDEDFSLALKVVSDCDYLLKSHSVLDEVIQELDLDIGYAELSKSVSTFNPENTRILEVTVEADSPENAKRIVDTICKIGQEKITEVMGYQQVRLYESGVLNEEPCNVTGMVTYLRGGIIAAILAHTMFLVVFLMDDSIRTDEDVERFLGLSILGGIPHGKNNK